MVEYIIKEKTLVSIADKTRDLFGATNELTTISTYCRKE